MAKVITFSRTFPAYHPRKGYPTFFVEKIWESIGESYFDQYPEATLGEFEPKHHTVREGQRWKLGEYFSPRVWSGKPYASKQIIIAPDIQIKKIWDVEIELHGDRFQVMKPTDKPNEWTLLSNGEVAKHDGLSYADFQNWFQVKPKVKRLFVGQIICWNDSIIY